MSKLDWGNKLTDGLVFAYVPTSRSSIDHVSGKAPTTFGGTVSTTEHPMRFVSGNADFGRTGADDITTEGTVLALVDWDATAASDTIIASGENGAGDGFEFWMDDTAYVSHGLLVETFTQRRESDWDIFDSNRFYTLGAAWGGTTCLFYVDGALKTTVTATAPIINAPANASRTTRVGINREGSHQLTGKIAYVYAWNRKLNAAEIASVTAEPYQFFIGTPEFVAVEPRSDTFRLLEIQGAPTETGIDITLVDSTGTALPNLSNLSWAWFDQSTIDSASTPTDVGNTGSTDGSGLLSLTLPNTTLTTGQTGMLALRDSTGMIYALYRVTI